MFDRTKKYSKRKSKKLTLGGFAGSENQGLARIIKPIEKDFWGKPRFRIDDINAKIHYNKLWEDILEVESKKDPEFAKIFELKKILYEWEGYTYYKELEKYPIFIIYDPDIKYFAFHIAHLDRIYINVEKLIREYEKQHHTPRINTLSPSNQKGNARNERRIEQSRRNYLLRLVRAKLFHELQHAIQKEERINLFPTTDENVLKYAQIKYGQTHLTPEKFKDWIQKKHNTDLASAIHIEYKNLPTEIEAHEVEDILSKGKIPNEIMKEGGIFKKLNKKYSFKQLFTK